MVIQRVLDLLRLRWLQLYCFIKDASVGRSCASCIALCRNVDGSLGGSCCAGDLAALTYHLAFHPSNHCTLHPHQSNRRLCLTSAYPTSLLSVSHAQHVNAKRGRRAAAHQLAQLFVRTPHFAIVEYSSPEDPVRADYRSTCKQPTAVSSCWVSRCCTNHGTGRRAGAAGAVSFAALC